MFHLNRIDALKNAFDYSDWFPKLFYNQNYNFGYGTPLFYSNIFIYIPALLYYLGLSLATSYKIFIFICSFLTSLSICYAGQTIFKKEKIAYLATVLYIFSAFQIADVYPRSALGEILALMIIPIVFAAIYKIVYEGKKCWILLGISFLSLLLVHNISFILMCFVFAVIICFNAKQIIKQRNWITIFKGSILAFGLTSFYLFPMLEQMLTNLYRVNSYFNNEVLVNSALNIQQLFKISTSFGFIGNVYDSSESVTMNIGIILTVIPMLYFFKFIKKSQFISICLICGYVTIIMTTKNFSWQYMSVLGFMQFPWRVLVVTLPMMTFATCSIVEQITIKLDNNVVLSLIGIMACVIGVYQMVPIQMQNKILSENRAFRDTEYYRAGELSFGDYLPKNLDINFQEYGSYIITNNTKSNIDSFEHGYNKMTFNISKAGPGDFYNLPLIYYKGYSINSIIANNSTESFVAYPNENGLVSFTIDKDIHDTKIVVEYKPTKIQLISQLISIFSLFWLLIIFIKTKRKNKSKGIDFS